MIYERIQLSPVDILKKSIDIGGKICDFPKNNQVKSFQK